jgi:hypothetical protein
VDTGGTVSEYGFAIRTNASSCGTITTSYQSATAEYAVPTTPTDFISTNSTCDGATAANTSQRFQIVHEAGIKASQKATTYSQIVTYTAFTK